MKILITHVDLDGFGVNILQSLYRKYIPFDDILNKNYGFEDSQEIKDLITPDNDIIITDLSIPENVFIEWKKILHSIKIIDHHESSKYLDNYRGNIWSTELCGTALFWENYVKPILKKNNVIISDKVEHFVRLVDCYDRWQDDSPLWEDATRLNKINQIYKDKFVSHMVEKLSTIWEWSDEEKAYYEKVEEEENNLLSIVEKELVIKTDNYGDNFCLIEMKDKSKVSMVCSKLLSKYKNIDYCIAYYPSRNSLSFRTKNDHFDLTKLQGVFGHKAAAGGGYDMSDFYKLLLDDYCVARVKDGVRKSQKIVVEKIIA